MVMLDAEREIIEALNRRVVKDIQDEEDRKVLEALREAAAKIKEEMMFDKNGAEIAELFKRLIGTADNLETLTTAKSAEPDEDGALQPSPRDAALPPISPTLVASAMIGVQVYLAKLKSLVGEDREDLLARLEEAKILAQELGNSKDKRIIALEAELGDIKERSQEQLAAVESAVKHSESKLAQAEELIAAIEEEQKKRKDKRRTVREIRQELEKARQKVLGDKLDKALARKRAAEEGGSNEAA